MALSPQATWLQPPDFMGAISTGAKLGLDRLRLANEARDNAGRLGLGYAQLGASQAEAEQRAEGQQAAAAAAMALRQAGASDLNNYRDAELAARNRGLDIQEQTAAAALAAHPDPIKLREGLAAIFTAASGNGNAEDAIKKHPEAAATLTGPQWDYVLHKKKSGGPRITIPVPSDDPTKDLFGNGPRISGTLEDLAPILGTNMPTSLRLPGMSTAADPVQDGPPEITTKEQFDALPKGTVYIGKDGRKYQKP